MKRNKDDSGRERRSIKTSRYNKSCVDFFRILDGTYEAKTKLWYFKPQQRDEIKSFFMKDKSSFTLC